MDRCRARRVDRSVDGLTDWWKGEGTEGFKFSCKVEELLPNQAK